MNYLYYIHKMLYLASLLKQIDVRNIGIQAFSGPSASIRLWVSVVGGWLIGCSFFRAPVVAVRSTKKTPFEWRTKIGKSQF